MTIIRSMFEPVLFAAALLASPPLPAPPHPQAPVVAPRLAIQISVEGLSPQLLEEYRPLLGGGLAKVADSEGTTAANGRSVVVAGSKAAALGFAAAPDQRWYWGGSGYVGDLKSPAPASIAIANAAIANEIASAQPALVPPPACLAKADQANWFARGAGDVAAFQDSPEGDGATLAVSAALVRELGLGRGPAMDELAVGLAAPGGVAAKFGVDGQAMCLALFSLDRDLGDFLSQLDSWGIPYKATLIQH
jgi:hypothetical protein